MHKRARFPQSVIMILSCTFYLVIIARSDYLNQELSKMVKSLPLICLVNIVRVEALQLSPFPSELEHHTEDNKTIGDEGITVDFRFIKVHTSN